jgi:hypothetical protein
MLLTFDYGCTVLDFVEDAPLDEGQTYNRPGQKEE